MVQSKHSKVSINIDMLVGWLHFKAYSFGTEYHHLPNIRCALFAISSNHEMNWEQGPILFVAWRVSIEMGLESPNDSYSVHVPHISHPFIEFSTKCSCFFFFFKFSELPAI